MRFFNNMIIKNLENGKFSIKTCPNPSNKDETDYFYSIFFDLSDIVAEKYPNFYINTTTLLAPCCIIIEGDNESYYILAMDDKNNIDKHIHVFGCRASSLDYLTLREIFNKSTNKSIWDIDLMQSLLRFK